MKQLMSYATCKQELRLLLFYTNLKPVRLSKSAGMFPFSYSINTPRLENIDMIYRQILWLTSVLRYHSIYNRFCLFDKFSIFRSFFNLMFRKIFTFLIKGILKLFPSRLLLLFTSPYNPFVMGSFHCIHPTLLFQNIPICIKS